MTNALTERVIRRVRRGLVKKWSGHYSDAEVVNTFDNVLAHHQAEATITDFIPVLAEAETNDLLDHNLKKKEK
ncbi:three-helix bundle dimerization domain-containing protein [Corynebacterium mayonis]|uniref:three-helix bundle dimerization domain-containing protein n=1 Tax=Corynebacterium mayonis TaxID=3062461 RepID=UPI0031402F11